jgi:hypothetical protein
MAFNPFHSMRRNSKAILAVVTIFIMVIFVLSSGIAGGDFFNDVLPRMLGGQGKNPTYAQIFGSKVRASEADATMAYRRAANQFMLAARDKAFTRTMRRLNQQIGTPGELKPETAEVLREIVANRLSIFETGPERNPMSRFDFEKYRLLALVMASPGIDPQNQQLMEARIKASALMTLGQRLSKEETRGKDYHAVQQVQRILFTEGRQFAGQQQPYFSIFSTDGTLNLEDALVFEMFLKKADELGIHYPTNVVNQLIQIDLLHNLEPSDAAVVEQDMRRGGRVLSSDDILKAIGDEFRVRAVVDVHLFGASQGLRNAEVTPLEFFHFYKDNRTEMTLNLVEVPVASFVPKVTAQPTNEELKKLYDQYKSKEYDQRLDTPGFRDPVKVKVEWIATTANSAYYEQNAKVVDGLTRLAAGFVPPLGTDPASGIAQVAAPHLWESLKMRAEYDRIVTQNSNEGGWDRYYFSTPHETSKTDRNTIAAAIGQIGLAHDPFNAAVHASLAESVFNHVANTVEARTRVAIGMPLVLAGYSPTPFNLLPSLAPAAASIPRIPGLEAYAKKIRDDLNQGTITRLFGDDIDEFKVRLRKIRTEKKDGKDKKIDDVRKETDAYVQQFVKDRGLQYGKSQEFRDRLTVHTDPGLKPLLDRASPPLGPLAPNPWDRSFFEGLPQNASLSTPGLLFEPRWFPPGEIDPDILRQIGGRNIDPRLLESLTDRPPNNPKEVGYLTWRSDYAPAKTWQRYDEAPAGVKAKVLDAWKFQKARELAKAEAERLATEFRTLAKTELRDKSNAPAFLNGVSEKTAGYKKIELTRVAPILEESSRDPRFARQYTAYNLPSKDIYFPGTMQKELLDLRTKPVGETVVVSDQPKGNFYVSTTVDKKEPTFSEFASRVYAKSATEMETDTLYREYVAAQTRQVLFTMIGRLKVESKFTTTEEYNKFMAKKDTIDEEQ